ncbi:MAG: hypothetical protein GY916_15175, partial [Gammaproteobacteria bacterium]|nr:hypothetical protein [Gammaproteobacteria bacterium]
MKKYLFTLLLVLGLHSGAASAVGLASFDILTLGDGLIPVGPGTEVDGRPFSTGSVPIAGSIATDNYIGLHVLRRVIATMSAAAETSPGGVTTNLNFDVYNSGGNGGTGAAGDWTEGSTIAEARPSPLLIALDPGFYLVKIVDTLFAPTPQVHNYDFQVISEVPLPAAAWLFGSAL